MKKPKAKTIIQNGNFHCLNCGGEYALTLPIPIDIMIRKIKLFNLLHTDCTPNPALEQPKPNTI